MLNKGIFIYLMFSTRLVGQFIAHSYMVTTSHNLNSMRHHGDHLVTYLSYGDWLRSRKRRCNIYVSGDRA